MGVSKSGYTPVVLTVYLAIMLAFSQAGMDLGDPRYVRKWLSTCAKCASWPMRQPRRAGVGISKSGYTPVVLTVYLAIVLIFSQVGMDFSDPRYVRKWLSTCAKSASWADAVATPRGPGS